MFQKELEETPQDMTITETNIETAVMAYRKYALHNEISVIFFFNFKLNIVKLKCPFSESITTRSYKKSSRRIS